MNESISKTNYQNQNTPFLNKAVEMYPGIDQHLGIDTKDIKILSMMQESPEISQDEIASGIGLSQPSIGARLKKLKEKGILHKINGINFKVVDLHLAKIDVTTTDASKLINEFKDCPFFINALITSGQYNACLFFTSTDLKLLEGIVDCHLRKNPLVKDVVLNLVVAAVKDWVMPINNLSNKTTSCEGDCLKR